MSSRVNLVYLKVLEFVIFKINYLNLACPHTKCMEPTGVTRSCNSRSQCWHSIWSHDSRLTRALPVRSRFSAAVAAGSARADAVSTSICDALLPFSHLFLSFVFVCLVVWVGLSFVPLGVALSGPSAVDAFVSFVFMLAWLLLCSLASLV